MTDQKQLSKLSKSVLQPQRKQSEAPKADREVFPSFDSVSNSSNNILALQHLVGNYQANRIVRQVAPKQVQRMATSAQLRQQAGEPKADVNLLITKKKMSTLYKAILTALDVYHNGLRAGGRIAPDQDGRDAIAEMLTTYLDVVRTKCQDYLRDHPDDERSPHIKLIMYSTSDEKALIRRIVQGGTFVGQQWDAAVNRIQPANKLKADSEGGTLQQNLFHGTSSALLPKLGGELMTGAELEHRGITTDSGEGDFYSSGGGGAKDFISVGEGKPGMGTALAYAQAVGTFEDYNPALYTDSDLTHEIVILNQIISHWDENLNKVPADDIMGARRSKKQFEGLLLKLQREMQIRVKLPANHPRHKGMEFSESTYPLMFEFTPDSLTTKNPRGHVTMRDDMESPRQLGGERQVTDPSVDLRIPGRLVRVYCPAENTEAVRARLTTVVGHSDFDVIAIETMLVPEVTELTRVATIEMMQTLYTNMRRLVLESYARGMTSGTNVDKTMLASTGQFIEVLKAMAEGLMKDQEIGQKTGIAFDNIPNVMQALFAYLGVKSRKEAVKVGKARGLIPEKY